MKRHRKRGRLKTGTTVAAVAYDSAGASVNEALGNDTTRNASASPCNLWIANGYVTFLIAAGIVLAATVVLVLGTVLLASTCMRPLPARPVERPD